MTALLIVGGLVISMALVVLAVLVGKPLTGAVEERLRVDMEPPLPRRAFSASRAKQCSRCFASEAIGELLNGNRSGPRSWLDSLLGACLTVLAAAVALRFAVGLVRRDWPWIIGGFAVVVLVVALVLFVRSRWGSW